MSSNSAEPSKINAQYNQAAGSAKQLVGALVDPIAGTQLGTTGNNQYNEGVAEQKAAEAKGYAEGTVDRVSGKVDNVVGAVTGDTAKQNEAQLRHDKGVLKQDINS